MMRSTLPKGTNTTGVVRARHPKFLHKTVCQVLAFNPHPVGFGAVQHYEGHSLGAEKRYFHNGYPPFMLSRVLMRSSGSAQFHLERC
jgi:hypothetical protein